MKRIVVLGAGVTGLAAADRLLEIGGCEVTVVEAESVVGGLAATIVRDGMATDLGPHRIHTELPEVQDLLPDLIGDRLLRVQRSSRMYLGGRWISYPLQAREVLRALGIGRVLRFGAGLAAARIVGLFSRKPPATFEDAMKRAFGAAAYRAVFGPYARKVWRTEPSQLSAEIARVRLPEQGMSASFGRVLRGAGPVREFLYVRGGIGQLSDRLAERVKQRGGRILLDSRATHLKPGPKGVGALVVLQPSGTVSLDADAVISTIPLPLLGAMLPSADPMMRAALANLEYLSILLIVLVANRERISPDHWLYFPQEPPSLTRACEPKNFDASLAPADKSCLCCEITLRRDETRWEKSSDNIAGKVERELAATGLLSQGNIVSHFAVRKDWAYPIYRLGFEKTLATVWPFLAHVPNLVTTGRQGLFNHNNIDHCLVMGRRAAEAVAANLTPARAWYDSLGQFAEFRILD
jgi:protoporphyrinogen oxidase